MNSLRSRIGFRSWLGPAGGLLLLLLGTAGCKGDGERTGGLLPRSRDPLMGADRIPPAGVPSAPGRDRSYGSTPRDPLFTGPTASTAGATKEPFRLTEDFTPAAMSVRGTDHADPLVIDDRRPGAVPTGGRGGRPGAVSGGGWEQLVDELRRIGGKPFAPVKLPSGEYEFRCGVPLDTSGAMRQYTGIGATPLAAVNDVYQQVRAERK